MTAAMDPVFMQTAPIPMGPARWRPVTQNPMLYAPGTVHMSTADRLEQRITEARRAANMLRPFGARGLSLADSAERQAEFLQGLLNGTRSADGGYVPDQLSATEKAYYSGESRADAESQSADYDSPTPGRYPNWGGLAARRRRLRNC